MENKERYHNAKRAFCTPYCIETIKFEALHVLSSSRMAIFKRFIRTPPLSNSIIGVC
jgi:hypothetical protein